MKTRYMTAAAFAMGILGSAALADEPMGDIEAGESAFTSQCQNCHNITNEAGDVLAGRPNVRTGPNLYGVIGRQAGVVEGFRYGGSLVEAGEAGLVWDAAAIGEYLLDPQGYLREKLDDRRARSQMSFRVRDEGTATDIVAFLSQFGAVEAEAEEAESDS